MAAADAAHWGAHGFGPWLAWDGEQCAGRCLLEHRYRHVLYRTTREHNSP